MAHSLVDIGLSCAALVPVMVRATQLGVLSQCLSLACLARPLWWICELGIAVNYIMHALIWYYPTAFTKACKQQPLATLGSHPVDVFSKLEVVAKLLQGASLLALLGLSGCKAAAATIVVAPTWCWAVLILFVVVGQTLNFSMYQAIGNAGVYYGFKLGSTVPWCYGFPFNVGLRHPQYVGVVFTLWGGLTLLLSDELAQLGLPQAVIVWGCMYGFMCAMEQAGDNDKAD